MARAYTLVQWTDAAGVHEIGDEVDLPRRTPDEKAGFERLLDYGIVSQSKPVETKAETKAEPEPEPAPAEDELDFSAEEMDKDVAPSP